ncbi:MAG: hypothetical protein ACOC97_04760 [Myxococcota bacterium]
MTEPARKIQPVEPANEAAPGRPAPAPSVRDLRRQRARQLALRLALAVGLPTLLATAYYGFADTREYESVTAFTIQSADGSTPASLELLFASVGNGSAGLDARIVQEYILSRDMLTLLSEEHGFVEHYSQDHVDWLSRLPADAPFEDRYDYFLDQVEAEFQTETGAVVVSVRAFSAEKANELGAAILKASERMVNRMMTEARQDRIDLARREVQTVEERLTAARRRLQELQADRDELDPRASAQAILQVKSSLEGELAEARAELNALQANLQPTAPELVAQKQRVAALQSQVAGQQRRLASRDENGLNADIAALEPALVEKEIAEQAYQSALKSLEMARLEADRQHRYLVTIAAPSQPDSPTHPDVFLAVLTVLVGTFALFGIGSLLLASVREHANL